MARTLAAIAGLVLCASVPAYITHAGELNDLYFGEALYFAHQERYFEALERLDAEVRQHAQVDEPQLDSLFPHIGDAEFSLGDFELRYRMHHRAGRAIKAVLEGPVDDKTRNDAAYRLARIHFQKNQYEDALRALRRIDGTVPPAIVDDIEFLRANVLLAMDRPTDALTPLRQLQESGDYRGFAAYNLGIAYLQGGQREAGLAQLDRAGQLAGAQPPDLAIRDKSNLVLGTLLFDEGAHARALPILNRVRLDGPFSNRALLRAGWASMAADDPERAVVPWRILAERDVTDPATQEALLALPFAYSQLSVFGRAAVSYGNALDTFSAQISRLDASIQSIREGRFLQALVREEIRLDKDWAMRLRTLPETPETFYLMELVATHDFQTGLQNLLDLADLRRKLMSWQAGFDSFDDMVAIRRQHYDPLLPGVDEEFRELDSRLRVRAEQHKTLVKRRDDLLTTPRPEFLATREEQADIARIDSILTQMLSMDDGAMGQMAQRAWRVKGLLIWTLETRYHERLTKFDHNLRRLDEAMSVARLQYEQFVRSRQAATHSYVGYDDPVAQLRLRSGEAIARIDALMDRQGRALEAVAVRELTTRRDRLARFGDKARFALADSYDRATQSQASRAAP